QKVRGGHESRLERIADALLARKLRVIGRPTRYGSFPSPFFPALLAVNPLLLGLASIGFGNGDAIGFERALDEHSVARKPGVLALRSPDRPCTGSGDLDRLALFEHVLLQLFPVVIASFQDARHERIEIGSPAALATGDRVC